jgi:RNA polymerase-binding transcription factor DksA
MLEGFVRRVDRRRRIPLPGSAGAARELRMSGYETIERRLRARLDELHRRTQKIQGDLRRTPHSDSEERAQEMENDEVLEHLGRGGLEEIDAIETALERIAGGLYGVCAQCGETIPTARLEAVPFTRTCIECAN